MPFPLSPQITGDLALVLQAMEEGITIVDGETRRFVFANEVAARMGGCATPAELLAIPPREVVRRYTFLDDDGVAIPVHRLPQSQAMKGRPVQSEDLRFREYTTGRETWMKITAVPLTDHTGQVRQVVSIFRDITRQRRSARALRCLSEASATLAQSLDYRATLQALARQLVPELAHGCSLIVLEEDGSVAKTFADSDPAREERMWEMLRRYPMEADSPVGPGAVMQSGEPLHLPEITDAMYRAGATDDEHYALLKGLGYRTSIMAPMRARGRVLGVLTLLATEQHRRFDYADLALARELADRAAQAVDNSRLYQQAQSALARKEEEARTSETLRRIGASIASELDAERLMQRLCDEATAVIGASMGAFLYSRQRDERGKPALRFAVAGVGREAFAQMPAPRTDVGLFAATLHGEIVRCDDVAADPRYGHNAPYQGTPPGHPPLRSYLAVPVRAREGEVVGGLFFGHPEPGLFSPQHAQLIADIAAQASTALENARLFQQLRAAERQSRDSEERLRLALEAGKLGYYVYDLRTQRATMSPRMEEILGYRPGAYDGTAEGLTRLVHPEDKPRMEERMGRIAREGRDDGELLRYRVQAQDGTVRWVEGYTRVLRDDGGRPAKLLSVRADVTDRIRADEQARRLAGEQAARAEAETSRRRTAAILDSISEPLFSLDGEGRLRFVNRRAEELAARRREDLVGLPAREAWPFSASPALLDRCLLALANRSPEDFEEPLPDGRWFEVRAHPVDDGLVVYLRDVTAHKREQDVQARMARYEALRADVSTAISGDGSLAAILHACGDAIVRHLGAGLVSVWTYNPQAQMLEMQANAGQYDRIVPSSPYNRIPLGQHLTGRIALERKPFLTNNFGKDPATAAPANNWARRQGYVAYAGYPLLVGEQLIGVMAMFSTQPLPEDVVPALSAIADALAQGIERRRTQQALAAHAHELARSNAELERFAYVASHDLQEPLRMVASYTQLIARRYKGTLGGDADEYITLAVDGVTRMKRLILDLLSYSRVGSRTQRMVPTPLLGALEAALVNLRGAIEDSGAEVTADPLPTVLGDELQLEELLQNLISNALKFHGAEPPRIHLGAERRQDRWVISVKDNGIGIDPQYFQRIFIIFQRLHSKDEYPGTGVGLTICKKIVERHGGRIWVESTPGHGATFFFTLQVPSEEKQTEPQSA